LPDHRPHDTPTGATGTLGDVPTDGPLDIPADSPTGSPASRSRDRSPLAEHLAGLDERRRQIAIALHYDERKPSLPRVVASGSGGVAEQILAAAFAAGVKVREDADLAEILAAVEVDSEIPLEALAAVAEILSYVYRANGSGGPQG
jgi:flagellar biosynthesis protein